MRTVPVSGTLYVDDKPHGPANLILTPVPSDGRPLVSARVAEDGSYGLSTYSAADEDNDGAPPGEYAVAFSFDVMNPANKPPGIKPESSRITVPDSDETVTLDIKLASTGKTVDPMKAMQRQTGAGSATDLMKRPR